MAELVHAVSRNISISIFFFKKQKSSKKTAKRVGSNYLFVGKLQTGREGQRVDAFI